MLRIGKMALLFTCITENYFVKIYSSINYHFPVKPFFMNSFAVPFSAVLGANRVVLFVLRRLDVSCLPRTHSQAP